MSDQTTPIHQAIRTAIQSDNALTLTDIRVLREKSERRLTVYKGSIWGAIILLNLLIWVELPLPAQMKIALAGLAILYTFSLPIVMIRRHQRYLPFFEKVSPGPKKKHVDENGQRYMEQVREQGRSFIVAEVEVLENRETAATGQG